MFPWEAFNFIVGLKLMGRKAGFQGGDTQGDPCYTALSFIRT